MRLRIQPASDGVPGDLGRPDLPGSKSHTQRAMVLAAFLPGEWSLRGALRSEDTEVLGSALEACGARVTWDPNGVRIAGRTGSGRIDAEVQLGENGTALRTLLVVVPMLGGRLRVDGREALRRRPIGPALDVLSAMGARVSSSTLPLTADGRAAREALVTEVAGTPTTQVATGVLLGRALAPAQGGWLRLFGRGVPDSLTVRDPTALGYLRVTRRVLELFGFRVDEAGAEGSVSYAIRGRASAGGELAIPSDPSARAFPLALAALHGREGAELLPPAPGDPHPDWEIDADLRRLVEAGTGELTLAGLAARPDCVPALAAVAAARNGRTLLPDLPALRHKESDRLQAMAAGIGAAGGKCELAGDGLCVTGPLAPEPAAVRALPTAPDHRIVMALALLGTVLPDGVEVENAVSVRKSWPRFFDWLERVAQVELLE